MEWHTTTIEFRCSRCGKAVIPGCQVGLDKGKVYCFRCGRNLELASEHRFIARATAGAMDHLRDIR